MIYIDYKNIQNLQILQTEPRLGKGMVRLLNSIKGQVSVHSTETYPNKFHSCRRRSI